MTFNCPSFNQDRSAKASSTSSENCCRLAVVGIGNPLKAEDSIGLSLTRSLLEKEADRTAPGVCVFLLDNFTSLLGEILRCHKKVLVVDSAKLDRENLDYIFLELTEESLSESTRIKSLSHGFSWMDEVFIALSLNQKPISAEIHLFAADSNAADRSKLKEQFFYSVQLLKGR